MDFEERIERGADAEKWKGAKEKDELPLWVADMDFACSDAITAALHARADERIYGYTSGMDDAYKKIVRAYYERHFGWHFPLEDLLFTGHRPGDLDLSTAAEPSGGRHRHSDAGLSSVPPSDRGESSDVCHESADPPCGWQLYDGSGRSA